MTIQGSIQPNWNYLEEFFAAMMHHCVKEPSRLAVWLIGAVDLSPLAGQAIGAASPFADSTSTLAGDGWLIDLQPATLQPLLEHLGTQAHLSYEILHFELEVNHRVQLAAYDHFGYVKFGDAISLTLLEDLKAQNIIESYDLFE